MVIILKAWSRAELRNVIRFLLPKHVCSVEIPRQFRGLYGDDEMGVLRVKNGAGNSETFERTVMVVIAAVDPAQGSV